MKMLAKAIEIAATLLADKLDKGGKPYILHCIRVMNGVDQNDPELMTIAILHDVVEDTDVTVAQLSNMGFSERVTDAIRVLTHHPAVDYDDYIKILASNPDAVKVKLEDLKDNSNITRIKGLRKKDIERIEKYHRAFTYLSN